MSVPASGAIASWSQLGLTGRASVGSPDSLEEDQLLHSSAQSDDIGDQHRASPDDDLSTFTSFACDWQWPGALPEGSVRSAYSVTSDSRVLSENDDDSLVTCEELTSTGWEDCPFSASYEWPQAKHVRRLGRGGCSEVFLCRSKSDGRLLAVKRVPYGSVCERNLCLREVEVMAKLADVEQVVDLVDWVCPADSSDAFIVMQFLNGQTLKQECASRCPTVLAPAVQSGEERMQRLGSQIFQILKALHDKGIAHLDIAPSNLIYHQEDGQPPALHLLDFGMAQAFDADGLVLAQGGQVPYMPPEQLHALVTQAFGPAKPAGEVDRVAGAPADMWAAGATLLHVFKGEKLFDGWDELDIATQHCQWHAALAAGKVPSQLAYELALEASAFDYGTSLSDSTNTLSRSSVSLPSDTLILSHGSTAGAMAPLNQRRALVREDSAAASAQFRQQLLDVKAADINAVTVSIIPSADDADTESIDNRGLVAAPYAPTNDAHRQLGTAANAGFTTMRIFAHGDSPGSQLQTAPGEYDQRVLRGLDTP
ncbi:hypothetical protein WJX72_007357 [[Myrmecia] bisecta]|uniref:Protein kinase domain-containing protein n=1 Tax=[Myrmecia] bisecta TaxID=41462 RepID=A0AAW1Q1Q0_9CHLO